MIYKSKRVKKHLATEIIMFFIILAIIKSENIATFISARQNMQLEFDEVQLVRVVDGDTLVVNNNGDSEKIRLLGVDTPESVHSDASKNNEYGVMASNYTKNLLKKGQSLYLSYDREKEDSYGRTLAYVWIKKDVDTDDSEDIKNHMLNAILLKDGMARVTIYEPNNYYEDIFLLMEADAKTNKIGLWQYEEYMKSIEDK